MDCSTEIWFRNPSHSNVYVRLAFVYSSGKCMSHKSRPMLQKNPNMARNSNSRNCYFGKQIIKFSWSWWLLNVTVPNPNQSTQRIVCLDSHVFLGPLKNNFDWKCASANLCQIPPSGSCIIMHQSPVRIKNLITLQFNTFQSHLPSLSSLLWI